MACDLFDAIHPSRVQRLRKSFGIGSTTTERLARRAPIKSVDSMEIPVSRLGDDRAVGVHRVAVAVNSRIDPAAVKEQPPVASRRVPPSRLPRVLRGSPVGLCRTRLANHGPPGQRPATPRIGGPPSREPRGSQLRSHRCVDRVVLGGSRQLSTATDPSAALPSPVKAITAASSTWRPDSWFGSPPRSECCVFRRKEVALTTGRPRQGTPLGLRSIPARAEGLPHSLCASRKAAITLAGIRPLALTCIPCARAHDRMASDRPGGAVLAATLCRGAACRP